MSAIPLCHVDFRRISLFLPIMMNQEMTREELESKATKFDELERKLREAVNCPVCLTTPKEGPLHQE